MIPFGYNRFTFLFFVVLSCLVISARNEETHNSEVVQHIRMVHDDGNAYTLEVAYYDGSSNNPAIPNYGSGRPGRATHTHGCGSVGDVPSHLRSTREMGPRGLGWFYRKYTHAYNIPVLGSHRIPDDALKRACYIVRFLLADNARARQSYYRLYGRFSLMAQNEVTTNIPEYADLGGFWDQRSRGLGATTYRPVSSGAEENILCYSNDRYKEEDIGLHEFSHGLHLLGLRYADRTFDSRLKQLYNAAKYANTWYNTYAMSTDHEYFAEGIQSYFEVNAYRARPDGIHGPISTRSALRTRDPGLYNLVRGVFRCGNEYIKRCGSTRAKEQAQRLKLDCQDGGGFIEGGGTDEGDDSDEDDDEDNGACTDGHQNCQYWKDENYCKDSEYLDFMKLNCKKTCNYCSDEDDNDEDDDDEDEDKEDLTCKDSADCCSNLVGQGFCTKYEKFMTDQCAKSCQKCVETTTKKPTTVSPNCVDENNNCADWSRRGECRKNPGYMLVNCKKSCDSC